MGKGDALPGWSIMHACHALHESDEQAATAAPLLPPLVRSQLEYDSQEVSSPTVVTGANACKTLTCADRIASKRRTAVVTACS